MDLTVANLEAAGLSTELDAIEAAVSDHLEGSNANVAVVAEPYAGRSFTEQVPVPRLDTEAITQPVREHVDALLEFVETDEHGRVKTFDVSRRAFGVVGDVDGAGVD